MTSPMRIEELDKTDRRIILFGTGKFAERLYSIFKIIGIKITYCLDNNKLKWDQRFCGINIYNPERLKEEYKDDIIIIVASTYYEDISNQLMEYGFEENMSFFSGEAIMQEAYLYARNSINAKNIIDNIDGRRIILYGADKVPGNMIPILEYLGYDFQYCVDGGLKEEDKEVFVLVFSDNFYETIHDLRDYGFFEFLNCFNGWEFYNMLFENQEMLSIILKDYSQKNKDCFFVQIGANDGIRHDPLREFILNNNWKGILVEPVRYIFEELRNNYDNKPGLIFENVAISDKNEWRDFYYFSKESGNDLKGDYPEYGSFIYGQIKEWLSLNNMSEKYLNKEKVPCLTIDSLLERNNIQKFDVLCIDVEGYDYEIVKLLNFNMYSPDIIIYEINHLSEDDRKGSFELLKKQGYRVLQIGIDAVAIK